MQKITEFLISQNILSGSKPIVIVTNSSFLEWKLLKEIKQIFQSNNIETEIIHTTDKNLNESLASSSQISLFEEIKPQQIIVLDGNIDTKTYSTLENNVIILTKKSTSKEAIKAISQTDDIIGLYLDHYRTFCKSPSLWNEIIQFINKEEIDIGKLFLNLDSIIEFEPEITKETLKKYGYEIDSGFLIYDLQNIFGGKVFNIDVINKTLRKSILPISGVIGYLKNTSEKLMILKDGESSKTNPITSKMHPFARSKLVEVISSRAWTLKGIQKVGELLRFERKSRKVAVDEEHFLKKFALY